MSPTTVAAAFSDLRTRGLVVTRERSRAYVSWRPPLAATLAAPRIRADLRDVATGNPDPTLLPPLKRHVRRLDVRQWLYGEDQVLPELLELAAAELTGNGIEARHLAVVSGALDGIERVAQAHLRPGDVVAVEDPGYPGVFDLLRALGLALAPIPVDERGMNPEALGAALDQGASAVVVTPRGQNPTGASLNDERARGLRRALARRPEVLVIEDDHLGPVAGAPRLTLTTGRKRWAAARSVSKSLGPDLRLAILAGDARTISHMRGRQLLGTQWVSHILQGLVAALWRDAEVAGALQRAAETYGDRRDAFIADLAEHGIAARAPAGGLNVWVPVTDEASVVQFLAERGWAVAAGAPYRLTAEPGIRITVGGLHRKDSRELAAALGAALEPAWHTRAA